MTEFEPDSQDLVDAIVTLAMRFAERTAEMFRVELDGLVILARLDTGQAAMSWPDDLTPPETAAALLSALTALCQAHNLPLAVAQFPSGRGQG